MLPTFVAALYGCGGAAPELMLEGEAHVHVEQLGEVSAPGVALSNGETPSGVLWTVADDQVARVDGGRVVAEGGGITEVTGSWNGQTVSWTLEVRPEFVLHFDGAPESVAVGETTILKVVGDLGGAAKAPVEIAFESSDPLILAIDDHGKATGVAVGTAYVTVVADGGKAMAEIEVR